MHKPWKIITKKPPRERKPPSKLDELEESNVVLGDVTMPAQPNTKSMRPARTALVTRKAQIVVAEADE